MSDFPRGMVWLVGAGPGDPELLTRKAERLIAAATVVFHDALVGQAILDLVPKSARLVSVGKRSGRHSRDQATIDRWIVGAALGGERVVRLKGGDPSIFGRATEELDACRTAGVPVSICPGITAASAAAASLGRSLTVRGQSRKLVLATAHTQAGAELGLDWTALADRNGTTAIYMGKAAAAAVSRGLIHAGLPGATPVAIVESASLPSERRIWTSLAQLPFIAKATLGDGPAIVLIGSALERPLEESGRVLAPTSLCVEADR